MNPTKLLLILSCTAALIACGEKPTDTAAPPVAPVAAPATAPASTPAVENAVGKKAYVAVCAMCHAAGVAGAPKPGNKADWDPRIAQGNDTLYKHTIEGFTGAKGMMPARGASNTLTDDELKAAVDYMVALSR